MKFGASPLGHVCMPVRVYVCSRACVHCLEVDLGERYLILWLHGLCLLGWLRPAAPSADNPVSEMVSWSHTDTHTMILPIFLSNAQ